MEETNSNTNTNTETPNSNKTLVTGLFIFILLGGFAYFFMSGKPATDKMEANPANVMVAKEQKMYKDGTYTVVGNYTSPAGPEEIEVSLVVKDDIVTQSNVVGKAIKPISQKMQKAFIDGQQALVVGKKLSDLTLDKVGGSSLTPKGFNDALEKIKTQAKS